MLRRIIFLNTMFTISLVFFSFAAPSWAKAALKANKTTVVFLGNQGSEEFDKKIKPLFEEKTSSCKRCEILNMTPYDEKGNVDMNLMAERIDAISLDTSFVFLGFNVRANGQNKNLVDALNRKVDAGLLVVGTAGMPSSTENSGPLSRTVLGQVRKAVIIGELGERERLMPMGFYGPEMLTAVRPPRDMMGQGFAPLIFAAALAENWPKRDPSGWLEFLQNKKMKTRKIWLDLGDIF